MWEIDSGVISVLMLSYQLLPSQLKQCFGYCAIFSQDYKITKEELIQLWMAECFVVKSREGGGGGDNLEELGEKYLQELVSRSFLQEHNEYDGSYFLMHDLISDLAQHISGEFSVKMEDHYCKFTTRNRYFSFKISEENSSNMLDSIHKPQFLRTFWSFGPEHVGLEEAKKIVDGVANDLLCLRVLSLRNLDVVGLPKSIEHLKHLRYLNLASTRQKDAENDLLFVQLAKYHCFQLVELPKKFGNLINLQYIDIRRTINLGKMPTGMGKLNKIVSLELDRCKDCTFLQAFELPSLERLSISNCYVVGKVSMSKPLRSLKTLLLRDMWNWEELYFCEENDPGKCGLLSKLEKLTITRCPEMIIIRLEGFPLLKTLKVASCEKLKFLSAGGEPLPQSLTSLASVEINGCDSLICFPKGGLPAPNMTYLRLVNLKNLKSLPEGMHVHLFALKHLSILWCPMLESFPEGGLPANLQSLEIIFCKNEVMDECWQPGLQTLHALSSLDLHSYNGDNLNCFPFPPGLTSLDIWSFSKLKFMNCKDLQHLTHLSIKCCYDLESFLQEESPSSPSEPFQQGGLLPNLQSLHIQRCEKLIARRLQWGLQRFKALSHLTLRNYGGDDLDSFPEEWLLPSTLTFLEISGFEKLKVINYKCLQHLTSLCKLKMCECYNLRLLKEELPSSLSVVKRWEREEIVLASAPDIQ